MKQPINNDIFLLLRKKVWVAGHCLHLFNSFSPLPHIFLHPKDSIQRMTSCTTFTSNKGLDQLLTAPGGKNRDSHGTYPFPGLYKDIGPGGATEQINAPGSVFKIVTAAAALEAGLGDEVRPDVRVPVVLAGVLVRRGVEAEVVGDVAERRVDVAEPHLRAAQQAIDVGAARLIDEYVGQSKPAPSLEEAREMLREQALNPQRFSVAELSESIQEGMALYADIGKYYNTFVRGMAGVDPNDAPARSAMQRLWNLSHGRAQRPERLTEGMQHLQDLMSYNPVTGGTYQRAKGLPGSVGVGGLQALMTEAARGVLMENVSPEEFAALVQHIVENEMLNGEKNRSPCWFDRSGVPPRWICAMIPRLILRFGA